MNSPTTEPAEGERKELASRRVTDAARELYWRINVRLPDDVLSALRRARADETSDRAADILGQLLENQEVSRDKGIPLCQDTGTAVAFVEVGRELCITGATVDEAVSRGIAEACEKYPLRTSMVQDPLERQNTGDNTPAVVHLKQVPGSELTLRLLAKGGGAENMSRLYMLSPGDGREGIISAVVETVREAGANACPPVIVGVGAGGTYCTAATLARRALLRPVGSFNEKGHVADMETEILQRVNDLGIGPQGLGGRTTALDVLMETAPCHIASMPVAVNLGCHAHRHGEVKLEPDGE